MAYEHTFINKGGQMKPKVLSGMSANRETAKEFLVQVQRENAELEKAVLDSFQP